MALKPKLEPVDTRVNSLAELEPGKWFLASGKASFILQSDPEHIWQVTEPTPKIMLKVSAWFENAPIFYKSQAWSTIQLIILCISAICDIELNPLPLEVDIDGFADLVKPQYMQDDFRLINSVMEAFEVNTFFRQQ